MHDKKTQHSNNNTALLTSPIAWLLVITYSFLLCFSNWFDFRLIKIFGHTITPGALLFPISFLIADILTEVYAYKITRLAIWIGFIANLFLIVFGQIISIMPSPEFALKNNHLFNGILAINIQIIIASFVSYFASEPLNARIISKMKVIQNGKYMFVRFIVSTIIAVSIDATLFAFIAFYNTYNMHSLIHLAINTILLKISIELLGLPFSVYAAGLLKKIERIDIYDRNTNFTLFSLDLKYSATDNEYNQQHNHTSK